MGPGRDQHARVDRVRRHQGCEPEGSGTDQQQPVPDPVAQSAHRHQERRKHEAVHVRDPHLMVAVGTQIRRQPRQREQHEQIDRDPERRQCECHEPQPLCQPCPPLGVRLLGI
jgi:hypothetical protein